MKRLLLPACAMLLMAACSDSTSPPVATRIVLSSSALSLDAIGASQTVTASVLDQHDQAMANASVAWTASSAAATVVPATTGTAAVITAALNGSAIITAQSGKATVSLPVTIAQVAAALQKVSGDAQTGSVNSPLSAPLAVRVVDRLGVAMSNQPVVFTATSGGGSVAQSGVSTGGDGIATSAWTLGKIAATTQQAAASLGALAPVTFSATAVAGAPATVGINGGDAQTGPVGITLSIAPSVLVKDTFGNPVSGATVNWAAQGGGSVVASSSQTNTDGVATSSGWTLPTTPGSKSLIASVTGANSVTFTATANVGLPSAMALTGDNQTATVSTAVPVAPSVRVTDSFGNAVSGVSLVFAQVSGGGIVSGGTQTTDAAGNAKVGSWTLGPVPGINTMSVSAPGTTIASRTFSATALAAQTSGGSTGGTPSGATIAVSAGTNQAVMAGQAAGVVPSVIVRDAAGQPMPNVSVTFAVASGGGAVSGASAVTNTSGIATVGSWTMGAIGALNTLTATVSASGFTTSSVTFTAAGCEGAGAGYAITVCYRTAMTPTQRQAFVDAAAKWKSIITSELTDVPLNVAQGACDTNTPSVNMTVDDVLIFAAIEPIDGVGAILGSAGWCFRRTGGLPVMGSMRFDVADVANLESSNRLGAVILHEMGHVLGIGTMWTSLGLLHSPSSSGSALDTYFSGANAIGGFDAIGGTTYTAGQKVPVENTGGPGTINSHWRESVLANELMTGFLNSGTNPLSALTVQSLVDIGYTVNAAAADPFFLTLSLRASIAGDADAVFLGNDGFGGHQSTVDARGRITRIR